MLLLLLFWLIRQSVCTWRPHHDMREMFAALLSLAARAHLITQECQLWCPVTNKVFTNFSHVVLNSVSGHVYSFDAVDQLNRKVKNWQDLISSQAGLQRTLLRTDVIQCWVMVVVVVAMLLTLFALSLVPLWLTLLCSYCGHASLTRAPVPVTFQKVRPPQNRNELKPKLL